MNILVKYPTRSRPEQFLANLSEWIVKAKDLSRVVFLVTVDNDDQESIEAAEKARFIYGEELVLIDVCEPLGKIHACNSGILQNWMRSIVDSYNEKIILLISDDMKCNKEGWDEQIRNDFEKHYPDTDGCMWYHDGSKQKLISTLSCVGGTYLKRINGNLYFPEYKSFFCDNEYTEVAQSKKKITFSELVIAKHMHPAWGHGQADELYRHNDKFWKEDQDLYHRRKAAGFPL